MKKQTRIGQELDSFYIYPKNQKLVLQKFSFFNA